MTKLTKNQEKTLLSDPKFRLAYKWEFKKTCQEPEMKLHINNAFKQAKTIHKSVPWFTNNFTEQINKTRSLTP